MADPKQQQQERMREALDEKEQQARFAAEEQDIDSAARTPDVVDPRAKNSGKGKKTADKWNQWPFGVDGSPRTGNTLPVQPIDVTHFSDPGCPWAYSAMPA